MSLPKYRTFPLGDRALTIEFGNEVSEATNDLAIEVARKIDSRPFEGFIETVPSYSSTTIFYDPFQVYRAHPGSASPFEIVKGFAETAIAGCSSEHLKIGRELEIPVKFTGEDVDEVAEFASLTREELIGLFTGVKYRVYMLGFLPGFAYMGTVDPRLQMPRRDRPRKIVPAGSVGIAGPQTGIYPIESPGGWRLIGRTEVRIFSPDRPEPFLLKTGDSVKFTSI